MWCVALVLMVVAGCARGPLPARPGTGLGVQLPTDQQVRPWIRHMLKENRAVMPHFAGELSGDKVRQILTYLRTLPPES